MMLTTIFSKRINFLLLIGILGLTNLAIAYPEFQIFIQKNSHRSVNCAFCHVNSNGPEGAAPGQIGSLAPQELEKLNRARTAFEPGQDVDSPILNRFGNHIIKSIGKTKFLEVRSYPVELSNLLNKDSDLDEDGIADVQEYLEGTHPLHNTSGDPWTLFLHNLMKMRIHVLMILVATAVTYYGLRQLLRGFAVISLIEERKNTHQK